MNLMKVSLIILSGVIGCHAYGDAYVQNSLSILGLRSTPLNSEFFEIPKIKNEFAAGMEGDYLGVNARFRLQDTQFSKPGAPGKQKFIIQELSRDFTLEDKWIINIGKTQLHWDDSLSLQPLGFFQKSVDLRDLTDNQRVSEGLPLLAVSRLEEGWDATLVYSDDFESKSDGFNRGLRQAAAQIGYQTERIELSVLVQKPENQRAGLGFSLNFSWSDAIVVYTSYFGRKGTRRPYFTLLDNAAGDFSTGAPFSYQRKNDHNIYERYVVGLRTTLAGVDYSLEYTHDDRQLGHSEWRRYLELVDLHQELSLRSIAGGQQISPSYTNADLGQLNLHFDTQVIASFNARQDYLFLYAGNTNQGPWAWGVFTRCEIDSRSYFSGLSLSREVGDSLSVSLSLNWLYGNRRGEYGIQEISSVGDLLFRYSF